MVRDQLPGCSELQEGAGCLGGDGENRIGSGFLEMGAFLVLTEVLVC